MREDADLNACGVVRSRLMWHQTTNTLGCDSVGVTVSGNGFLSTNRPLSSARWTEFSEVSDLNCCLQCEDDLSLSPSSVPTSFLLLVPKNPSVTPHSPPLFSVFLSWMLVSLCQSSDKLFYLFLHFYSFLLCRMFSHSVSLLTPSLFPFNIFHPFPLVFYFPPFLVPQIALRSKRWSPPPPCCFLYFASLSPASLSVSPSLPLSFLSHLAAGQQQDHCCTKPLIFTPQLFS